ncbi:hypothetical protein ACSSS7_001063 [Eimeria intestinalis]
MSSRTLQALQQVPPEPPFQTTNGLYWTLKCQGKELRHLPSGPAEIPVYAQLGSGQFGRVFEVLPSPPPSESHSIYPSANSAAAATAATAAAAAAKDLAIAAADKNQSPAPAAPGAAAESWRPPSGLPSRQLYAAKLLPLSNFAGHGTTADLLREFSLYRELDAPATEEGSGFANILRVYGIASCVSFSKAFADAYLSGVQTAGVLVVEQCASDLAAFAMRLQAQGKLNHSALKFYAWQLLNGVARLHGRGVVHRDLKPENILVAAPAVPEGQQLLKDGVGILKVADLGLGRKIRSLLGQEPAGTSASSLPVREDPHNKQQQQQVEQQQQQQQQWGPQDGRSLCMRQSGRVVTLPYRPPEILVATANNQSAAKLPAYMQRAVIALQVASYSSACDMWSLGVILLELCLPQKAPRPHMWNFAFILHTVGRAAFQMEFMILENILKVLGRPKEHEEVLDMISLAGDQRADLLSFVGAFPSLSHSERKMAILDYIAEKGGLHLDALGLDLLARELPRARETKVICGTGLLVACATAAALCRKCSFSYEGGEAAAAFVHFPSLHPNYLEIPALRASLPSPLRRCLTTWEARGRCPSSTRFACHELLQQALLQQRQQQQHQQQQQRSRCCSNPDVLKYPGTIDDAAAGHEASQQQQQQQQQQAPSSSRRSGENSRRSGSNASAQKLRSSNSSHSSAKALPTAAAAGRQQQQQPSSSAKSLRSSGPATLQRRSSSSINRSSDSLSREQPKQKTGEGGAPAGASRSIGVSSGALTRDPQRPLSVSGRQREQRQRCTQLRHREQQPFRSELREGQQCAGSDDEVVRSPWRCTRPTVVSASTSVLQSLPPYPSLSQKGPPLPGRPPLRASSAIITAAAVAATARRAAVASPTKCQRAAATLECRSGNSTPYHDALSDHSCSPSGAPPSAAATAPVSAAPSDGANENVDHSQEPATLCCSTATSGTKSRRRGPPRPFSKAPAEDHISKGGTQALALTCPLVEADGKEQKTLRRAKRLRRGSATTGHCFP